MYCNGRIGFSYVIGNCIRHRGFNESGADAINTNVELGKFFGGSPGVNFINVLRAAFMLVDPESVKKYSQVVNLFFGAFGMCARKSC